MALRSFLLFATILLVTTKFVYADVPVTGTYPPKSPSAPVPPVKPPTPVVKPPTPVTKPPVLVPPPEVKPPTPVAPPAYKPPVSVPPPVVKPPVSVPPPAYKPPVSVPPPVVTPPAPVKVPPPVYKPPVQPSPPLPPVKSLKDCIPLCDTRCSLHSRPNICKRACMTCCGRCKCVPPGTYGNREKCGTCYADMRTRGNKYKCP